MTSISVIHRLGSVGAMAGVLACADLGPSGPLQVTLAVGGAQASRSDPVLITVIATNNTTARVSWGVGSSSCTLGAAVRVNGTWVPVLGERVCTGDMAEHALDPGNTRTEAFSWSGQVRRNGRTESLPPGTYQIRGEAGSRGTSGTVTITVSGAA